jgi:glyoxylase-like metal-dependent hydrolase (beta-lactamase superfamily II)
MRIHPIQTGNVRVKQSFLAGSVAAGGMPQFLWRLQTDGEQAAELPIMAWLIEHDEGLILVDTGELASTPASALIRAEPVVRPDEELLAQLGRLGVRPGDITRVVLTHLHSDHVDGMLHFPALPTFVSERELQEHRSFGGRLVERLTIRLPAWFDPQPIAFRPEPYGAFATSFPLTRAGDVLAVPTPGHTAGHLSVIVRGGDVDYMLAGDVTYSEAALLAQAQQGPCADAQAQGRTLASVLRHVRQVPTVYLPAHDPAGAARLTARQAV